MFSIKKSTINSLENNYSIFYITKGGTIDKTFGENEDGKVVTNIIDTNIDSNAVLQLDTENIYLAGTTTFSYDPGVPDKVALVKYTNDGILDDTFGPDKNGKVITDFNSDSIFKALQLDNDYIYVAGTTSQDFVVVRYNKNGTIDDTFGTNGKVITDINNGSSDKVYSLQLDTNHIYLAGRMTNDFAVVRYNKDGTIDNTFGPDKNGKVVTDINNGSFDASFSLQLNSNYIYMSGFTVSPATSPATNSDFVLVRYNKGVVEKIDKTVAIKFKN